MAGENWGLESVFEYNGLVLNQPGSEDRFKITQITGLADADIRDERTANTGHGEHRGSTLYGGRTIVLRGQIRASSAFVMREMIQDLKQAFNDIDAGEIPLFIRPSNRYAHQNWINNPNANNDTFRLSGTVLGTGGTAGIAPVPTRIITDGDELPTSVEWVGTTRATATSNSLNYYHSDTTSGNRAHTFPDVTGVKTVYVGGSMKPITALPAGGDIRLYINWYNAANGLISTPLLQTINSPAVNTWHRLAAAVTPPANAVRGAPFLSARLLSSGTEYIMRTGRVYMSMADIGYNDENSIGWALDYNEQGVPVATAMRSLRVPVIKNQPLDIDESQQNFKPWREFMITLRASNPRLTARHQKSQTMTGVGGVNMNVVNDGRYKAQTLIEIVGPWSNASLRNNTTGEIVGIGTVLAGQRLWLDGTTKRTYDQAGANKASALGATSQWIHLAPGTNNIEVVLANPTDPWSANVTIHWRDTWI